MLNILSDPRLLEQLERIDQDLADEVRARGCPHCGGRLHSANYQRRPRCGPLTGEAVQQRLSLCCGREGCRRRATPPSVRFLGRRVYAGAVVVLASAMEHGLTAARYRELRAVLGVSRRTVERWRRWWRETFAVSRFWEIERADFMPPPRHESLPGGLLNSFLGDATQRLVYLLYCIAPITTSHELDYRGYARARRGCR